MTIYWRFVGRATQRKAVGVIKGEAHLLLEQHLRELHMPFMKEVKFDKNRKWRLDYLLCPLPPKPWNQAIEIDGGVYSQGRHTRGKGFEADLEKMNAAVAQGYKVYRFSTGQVLNGTARQFIEEYCL